MAVDIADEVIFHSRSYRLRLPDPQTRQHQHDKRTHTARGGEDREIE